MDDKRNIISSKQLFVFLITVQIGIGILTLPSVLVKEVGQDAWISIGLAGIFSTLVLVLIMLLLKRYVNKSIFEINHLLYSKYLGGFLNLALILYTCAAAILGTRIFTEIIKVSILKLTPATLLTFFIMIPTVYLTWYGLKPICRFANILFFILTIVILFFILIYKHIRLTFLLPVGEASITTIGMGVIPSMFAFLGIELIAIIYPNIDDKEKAMKYAVAANLFSMAFFILVIIVTTGLFGVNMLKRLEFPLFSLSRSYRAPIIERVDLFFISLWFPAMASSLRKYFFSAYYSFNKVFRIKNTKIFLAIYSIAVVLLSRIPKDLVQTNLYLEKLNIVGIAVMGFIVLSYIFSFINKRGVGIQ